MSEISKKIILVGHYGVGKTSLVRRFVHSIFSDSYLTTIGVNIEKRSIDLDGMRVNLILWDLAGESDIAQMREAYFKGSHGILHVLDVQRELSAADLENQRHQIFEKVGKTIPILSLANKSDLLEADELLEKRKLLGPELFGWSSAKSGEGVERAFYHLAQNTLQR